MKKLVVCICIITLLASTFYVGAFGANLTGVIEDSIFDMSEGIELLSGSGSLSEPAIKPISGHPRVFLTPEYVEKLKLYIQTEEIRPAWNVVKRIAESIYNSELSKNASGNYDADIVNWIQCRTLVYALGEKDANWAKDTILHATNVLRTVTFDENKSDVTREKGAVMVMGAIVYDWCYDQMTDVDKAYFIKRFKEICATKEIGYPPKDDLGSTGGHNGEYEIHRDMLSCGIACYDEDPEMYNYSAGILFSKFAASRKLFNSSGNHPQGSAYGRFRLGCELYAELLFKRMGYPSVYGEEIENVIMRYIYARRPDGMILKDSDDYVYRNRTKSEYYNTEDWYALIFLNAMYDDPYVRGQFIKELSINGYSSYAFWLVVCADPNKPYKTEDDLPTAYKTTYPLTSMFHRTSWESGIDSDVAMAQFKANEINIGDHMHLDTGTFQIYYKGALAIDSGYYESGSEHSLNYDKRTIAHNLVTVYDPNEKFIAYNGVEYANDGGQKFNKQLYAKDYEYMMSEDCHYADTKGTYIGPDDKTPAFSYLKTDLSPAYSDKIESYNRSMVFLDLFDEDYPAAFVVFDNVTSSDKTFDKKWLLHSIEKPVVEANTTVISRTENGYGGKLVNKTLMPSAFNIEKVGGEGKEFWVDGNNYPVSDISPNHSEKGSWRIELSPENESENDVFLNAMYVTDNDKNLPELPMYKESMSGFVGVTIKDRMVMFSENADTQTENFSLTVRENGYNEVTCLIADVEEGIWNISGNGTNVYAVSSSGEDVICFKAKPGSYTVSKVDEVPDDDAEPEVGPWIADFSEMTSGAGKQLENNGCYLNMADINNWIYDSEGDYVNTNAQSADLRIGEQYAEDYTIGFKMNAQTQGNLRLQLYGQLDNSTKGSSASISKPEAFDFHEKIREVQPEGGRSLLFVHRVNTIDFTNSVEKAGVQEKTTITKNIKSGTWVDMRIEIDFSDDANSDVLFTAKTYMNNEYVSCIEIPRYVVTKFNGSYYWAKIISPAFFPINSGKNTLIKDMYMYSGIENKSIIPESFMKKHALVDEDFSNASSGDKLDVATKGTEVIYNDGYATISYTSNGNANVTGSPTIGIASPSVVNDHFIYGLNFKCDDFYTERYLFNSNINGVTTNPLRIDTSIRDGATRNGADLRLVNYDANSKTYDVATCRIVKGQWYSAQIIGKRDAFGKMSFAVTIKNVATNEILMNATMTDEREGTLVGAIPWKIVAGTKAELNALSAGTTSSFCVDDVYFAKVLDACEISDVKLFQGMDFLADTYSIEEDVKVNVLISNNVQAEKTVTLYVAEYNSEKEMLQIVPLTKTIEAAEVKDGILNADSETFSIKLTPSEDSSLIQCFFWDGEAGSIAPVSKQISINSK